MRKKKLGERLRDLFSFTTNSDEFYEELEDLLIEADLGAQFVMELSDRLRSQLRVKSREDLVSALRETLLEELKTTDLALDRERLNIVLVLGVNGVGKTTNLAKIARVYQREWPDAGIVLAAGDTFRAAAVEQLTLHAEGLGVRIVKQSTGSDAGAVIWDAIDSAEAKGERILLADTAGRMHNRADLVQELGKIDGIIRKRATDRVVYRKLLVVDGTTGQNALRQAELFHETVGVDGLVLSKYDSTARGGVLVPLARQLGLGCIWLGTGEGYDDLRRFDPATYVEELIAP
ncbi:MAG: signal recognition particle-docking protein FtsY [Spirochaetales bacterium]|nr:signal recognition particle-docking protein FtsY [Spirochaetales bacterium]